MPSAVRVEGCPCLAEVESGREEQLMDQDRALIQVGEGQREEM